MYKLKEDEHTFCIEFIPVTMNNVSVDVESTSLNINIRSTKSFSYYTRSIINMHKWHISLPEYIIVYLKCGGTPTTPNQGRAYLIIYRVKYSHSDVPADVYDSPSIFENNKGLERISIENEVPIATKKNWQFR